MKDVNRLRVTVNYIDSRIVKLIAKRFELTKDIGEEKKRCGIPLRNWEVEKTVIDNAVKTAVQVAIPPALIKSIMQQLIAESCKQQEMLHYSCYNGAKEKILVIGGNGNMGRWFSSFLKIQGHNVAVYDTRGKVVGYSSYQNIEKGLNDSTCVLIATPLEIVPRMVTLITKMRFRGLLFDIASLKGHLERSIRAARDQGMLITSIHPMFGPRTRILSDKVICICDCGNSHANEKVKRFFKTSAVSLVQLSLKEHDQLISYVLGLSHLVNVIFMDVLRNSGYRYSMLKKVASTTFLSQMTTAASVINENPRLYFAIQKFNPYKNRLFAELLHATKRVTKHILERNEGQFKQIMSKSRAWLGADNGMVP